MLSFRKSSPRRAEIRKNRPDTTEKWLLRARAEGQFASVWVAAAFFVAASAIVLMREEVVPWRAGQWAPYDVRARVKFVFPDKEMLEKARQVRRNMEPRVYKANPNVW